MEFRPDPPSRPPNPSLPYREDCWSEGETSVLIDAWGDRYVELNRGSLRQKQWQEVADAVNSRPCDARRPPRTDVQCKNRVDTLKKKYKTERSKIADGGASRSQWNFYDRMDYLVGSSVVKNPPPLMAVPLPAHRKGALLPTAVAVRQTAIVPVVPEDESESTSSRSSWGMCRKRGRPIGKGSAKEEGDKGMRQLARAIERMAEIYEKVEMEKQRRMVEMERQRMEFAKTVEFQRMQILVDTQVSLMKAKRSKRNGGGDDEHVPCTCFKSYLHGREFFSTWQKFGGRLIVPHRARDLGKRRIKPFVQDLVAVAEEEGGKAFIV